MRRKPRTRNALILIEMIVVVGKMLGKIFRVAVCGNDWALMVTALQFNGIG